MLKQQLISQNKYEVKCPYSMVPKGICIHNTANDAPAQNEITYMKSNDMEVSFHIAIDDIEAIQAIPLNRNTWHAGDGGSGEGNRNYIAVEICYSRSGGDRFINAEKRAAKEVAALLKQYGWTINNIKKHQDFSGKYCPHRTLDLGWQRFLDMVQAELNGGTENMDKVIGYVEVVENNHGSKKLGSLNAGATVEVIDYWSTLTKIKYEDSFAYIDTSALESRAKKVNLNGKVYEANDFKKEIGTVNGSAYIVQEYSDAYKIYWNGVWGYVKKVVAPNIDLEKENVELKKENKELKDKLNKIKVIL